MVDVTDQCTHYILCNIGKTATETVKCQSSIHATLLHTETVCPRQSFSPCLKENTTLIYYKDQLVTAIKKIIVVYSESQ